jgi:hypothetical protein
MIFMQPTHAEEVLDVVLPARDQAMKILQPGEEPYTVQRR